LTRYEWLIAPLLLQGSNSADARILQALPLDIDALIDECPHLLSQRDSLEWNDEQGTLRAQRRWQVGQLVLKTQPLSKPSEDE
ncbi:hypothetical protein JVV71_20150, partial [Vibrio cholerae O1]|nr:hypothetical protein [Vibrio cholerae O1]